MPSLGMSYEKVYEGLVCPGAIFQLAASSMERVLGLHAKGWALYGKAFNFSASQFSSSNGWL